jgi:mono/diheme cytochrome c family protein
MHVVFGIASVGMLITTFWMLAADHTRSWKGYQRQFRDIETWTANARIDEQENADYQLTKTELHDKLIAVQSAALSDQGEALFAKFVEEAKTKTRRQSEEEHVADSQAADFIAQDVKNLAGYTDANKRFDLRMDLYNRMRDFIARIKFREDNLSSGLKFEKAALDKAFADYSLAVGEGKPADDVANFQIAADNLKTKVEDLTKDRDSEKLHRESLENILRAITAESDQAEKNLKEHEAKLGSLEKARELRRSNVGKNLLELPILDAFNSPLKVDQIWLPSLTLNNNFRDVARFDRCNTCHQAIEKTAAGSATLPLYPVAAPKTLALATPKEAPKVEENQTDDVTLEKVYGLRLADRGQVKSDDVTVSAVYPNTPAAQAGLMPGDVITRVNDAQVTSVSRVVNDLLITPKWGTPVSLSVRRGLPEPFASHPRLDLFVGSMSPHPMQKFGCTICHQGQGSATSFEYASHTPSSPQQASEWEHDYGWAYNHHWIFPMYPKQFAESGCVKCHHEIVDLEASPKFAEPPAPTLVKGYEIVRNFGCFGCHEINGYNGPTKRVGPDVRAEPAFYAAAAQIRADKGFSQLPADAKEWVTQLIEQPGDDTVRRRLYEFVSADAQSEKPVLSASGQRTEALLKDIETPGTFRKVGPSLRHVASKDSFEFLYSWVHNPRDFRPSTKMPRFFGLWNHLVPDEKEEDGKVVTDEHGHPVLEESGGLKDAKRFEPIEVRAISSYLMNASQPFEYIEPYSGIGAQASGERGKKQFETRGCLACHQHADFPQAKATQGPDLSRMGAKLSLKPYGKQWLYSWLRNPSHYHARTVMPNVMLTPIVGPDGQMTDPAADITAFLMQSTQDWKPTDVPSQKTLTDDEHKALNDLALLFLKEKFPEERAAQYLKTGIPVERSSGVKGDELVLVNEPLPGAESAGTNDQDARVLKYVGRRVIGKYGCAGCHDIPGFEDSKPIGTALADWGKKDPARLAFEQVGQYISHYNWPTNSDGKADPKDVAKAMMAAHGAGENMDVAIKGLSPTQGWLMEKLLGHEREGFLWQKLREPRSFDFKKTENKGYNERLRMPQFPFDEDQIEAVMTFVLGLTAEPPADQYVAKYNNNPRQQAIISGTKLVEQFNCAGCHQLDFQRWDIAFMPGELGNSTEPNDYPFELPHFTDGQITDSKKLDRRGNIRAQLYGTPLAGADGKPVTTDENEDGDAFAGGGVGVRFVLWRDTLLDGKPWLVGAKNPLVPESTVVARHEGRGGDLGRWIFPVVVTDEQKVNPNAKHEEAWGWLPPPLVGEGKKVQTRWLHDFLLEPYPIRPAVVLRMPKFNMSSPESGKLVDFFAARDDAPAPYEFDERTSADYLTAAEAVHQNRLVDALRIVTDNNYCVKCHKIGDFTPAGSVRAMAPQLDQVNERLRPDYVLHWVGNPKRVLPYTGMPVNIPFDKPVDQNLFAGDSMQQLNGVVDLLMNWSRFTKERFTLKPYIKAAPPAATGAGASQ